jgi:hypothetical protein
MGPGFVIDSRLRQTSGDRIAMPQGRAQVGGADAEELLARIEVVTMLGREGASRGHALDIGEQQAAGR